MKRRVRRRKRTNIRHKGRAGICFRILALFVVCLMPFLLFRTAAAAEQEEQIVIMATSGEILQGEKLPQAGVRIYGDGDGRALLDRKSGYTVGDLLDDLNGKKGYTLRCEADTSAEGDYPVQIILDERISSALEAAWVGLVSIKVEDGLIRVKNPVGEWEGSRFRRYDGSYVINDFVVSKGDTYYFDEDGNKATGLNHIDDAIYYFDAEGVMKTGWQDIEQSRYYFTEEGAAAVGWQELYGATYYFDNEAKMVTGEKYLGLTLCVFDKDGRLLSKKESSIDPDKPMVALTFDDGPGPRTKELLDALQKYNAHATFFMLGQKVPSYADQVKRMKELGCELGNHSYDHADLSKMDEEGVQSEISRTNENIRQATGQEASLLRPPYGAISSTMKTVAGMPMMLWNIDTLDWKTRDVQKTIDAVMGSVKDGDVILMHDIHTESVDAALELIPKLLDEGYQLVTVSELAGAKGNTLHNGGVYTDF